MTKTITTAEDLDALPITSVIRCDDNEGIGLNVCERHQEGWQYVGSSLHFSSAQVASDGVAFTVLYRPDQPTEPARVLPSREEVREAALSILAASDHEGGAGMHWLPSKRPTELAESVADHISDAVLALFASAPTVEQVKAEALREAKEWIEEHSSNWTNYDLISGAQASVGMIEGLIDRLAPAQPVPDVPEVGLPTAEVPNIGGEQR